MVGAISNPSANFTVSLLNQTQRETNRFLEQLSTGLAVNSAADNAAALSQASRLFAEGGAFGAVRSNIGQAQTLLQATDGALANIDSLIGRNRQLAVQASNGTLSDTERSLLDTEFQANLAEINRISEDFSVNGVQPIATDGTASVTVGTGAVPGTDSVDVDFQTVSTDTLGLTGTSIATQADAEAAITALGTAQERLTGARVDFGASDSRLDVADRFVADTRNGLLNAANTLVGANIPEAFSSFQSSVTQLQTQLEATRLEAQRQGSFLRLFA